MANTSIYLNFPGNTEEAFTFYKSVFGGEFLGDGILRFGDVPPQEGAPAPPDEVKHMIMHMELGLPGGLILMGSDAPEPMGFKVTCGNNFYITIEPDTRKETKDFFDALAVGGKIETELQEMFWGAYYGVIIDKFSIQWMFNCMSKI